MEILDISAQEGFVTVWSDIFHMWSLCWHASNQIFSGNFVPDSRGCGFQQEKDPGELKVKGGPENWRQTKCQSPPKLFTLVLGAQAGRWGLYFQNLRGSDNQLIKQRIPSQEQFGKSPNLICKQE